VILDWNYFILMMISIRLVAKPLRRQTIHSAIRYYDDYEREEGAWRFANRTLKFAYAVPVSELGDSLTDDLPVRWPGADPAPADEN
jgi:hypothetical protein